MPKHKPGSIWMMRSPGKYPNGEVSTTLDGRLSLSYYEKRIGYITGISMSRRDARLLAKRINQCLDETK